MQPPPSLALLGAPEVVLAAVAANPVVVGPLGRQFVAGAPPSRDRAPAPCRVAIVVAEAAPNDDTPSIDVVPVVVVVEAAPNADVEDIAVDPASIAAAANPDAEVDENTPRLGESSSAVVVPLLAPLFPRGVEAKFSSVHSQFAPPQLVFVAVATSQNSSLHNGTVQQLPYLHHRTEVGKFIATLSAVAP